MSEILVILSPMATAENRQAIQRIAPPMQSISGRVFLAQIQPAALAQLHSMPGVAQVLTGTGGSAALAGLDEAETLFAQAWVSRQGQTKQRIGEGLDWDTPPMLPPDKPVQ
jgi:hypothetical protein